MTRRKVAWLVPYPLRGSGGHRTIFQNITALAFAGYECHVYLERPPSGVHPRYRSAAEGRTLVEQYFGSVPAKFHIGFEVDAPYDLIFATAWFTAEPLRRLRVPGMKAYFIQDYEASFMPMGDHYLQAQNSFRYGFAGITIGRWLSHRLHREFGMECAHFDFCADLSVYHPRPEIPRERAICFIYQPEKPRRCSGIGGEALALVKRQMPDVKLYFYGADTHAPFPYEHENLGLLPIRSCAELYNRCQVGLCISSTNPSRVPFEMMAAGLPVVDLYGENNLYDLPEGGALLAEPTPESIAHALMLVLRDPERQRSMSEIGTTYMASRDLGHGFSQFTQAVDDLLGERRGVGGAELQPSYRSPAIRAPEGLFTTASETDAPLGAVLPAPAHHPNGSVAKRLAARLRSTVKVLLTGDP